MDREDWAKQFKAVHECKTCPFVKNDADVGVGIIYDCDHVCTMPNDEILEYMAHYAGESAAFD